MYGYTIGIPKNNALMSSGNKDSISESVKDMIQHVLFYMARKDTPHNSVAVLLQEFCDNCKGIGKIYKGRYKCIHCKKCNGIGILNTIIPETEITKEDWMDLPK